MGNASSSRRSTNNTTTAQGSRGGANLRGGGTTAANNTNNNNGVPNTAPFGHVQDTRRPNQTRATATAAAAATTATATTIRDNYYLQRGGPQIVYHGRNGFGPTIFQVEPPASAPAVTTPDTIKCNVNLPYKDSLVLRELLSSATLEMEFRVDANVAATATVHWGCVVSRKANEGVKVMEAVLTSQPCEFPAGIGQTVVTTTTAANGLADIPEERRSRNAQQRPRVWPLVIELRTEEHVQYSFCNILASTTRVTLDGQLLQVGTAVYKLEDVYGGEDSVTNNNNAVDSDGSPSPANNSGGVELGTVIPDSEDNVCVVCLCEPKDTTVLPCRHMCLCMGCAEIVKAQTNKCPMCRQAIVQLVKR
eukprot:PhM_4_TR13141/c0_g1_i1/m.58403